MWIRLFSLKWPAAFIHISLWARVQWATTASFQDSAQSSQPVLIEIQKASQKPTLDPYHRTRLKLNVFVTFLNWCAFLKDIYNVLREVYGLHLQYGIHCRLLNILNKVYIITSMICRCWRLILSFVTFEFCVLFWVTINFCFCSFFRPSEVRDLLLIDEATMALHDQTLQMKCYYVWF